MTPKYLTGFSTAEAAKRPPSAQLRRIQPTHLPLGAEKRHMALSLKEFSLAVHPYQSILPRPTFLLPKKDRQAVVKAASPENGMSIAPESTNES
jgi:hypothetical protein